MIFREHNRHPVARRCASSMQSLLSSTALVRLWRAGALGLTLSGGLLATPAWAACTPVAANGVTVTCTGAITNQGGGPPGSTGATAGYGTGGETGVIVDVATGAVNMIKGTDYGIFLGDATVTNHATASITGGVHGIYAATGFAVVTNSGSITGTSGDGIQADTNVTATNNVGARIKGGVNGIAASNGSADVTNSGIISGNNNVLGNGISASANVKVTNNATGSIEGSQNGILAFGSAAVTNFGTIDGTANFGIFADSDATVINNAGASITGGYSGIFSNNGSANVMNSGIINGASGFGILANTNATVINTSGASITGGDGISAFNGVADVTNSGSITGTSGDGIFGETNVTATNNAGASITGSVNGITVSIGSADVTNSGIITGTSGDGIFANTNVMATNNAGASITGSVNGISVFTGFADVTNSGIITGTSGDGIFADTNVTATNNAGGRIKGGDSGITVSNGSADVTNSGRITGTSNAGIFANTNATVTNNATGSIEGGIRGIFAGNGSANVTNSGIITGTGNAGIFANTDATVTNNATGIIEGGQHGIYANTGFANVTNSGSIVGTTQNGIRTGTDATVTNNANANITGGVSGIAIGGIADVTNSGSITGTSWYGIWAVTNVTVTNNADASITGGHIGIATVNGFAAVTNFGSITGTADYGIWARSNATVMNTGSIAGGQLGIVANGGGSSVFNAGTISGGTAAIQFSGTGNTLTLAPGSVITGNVLGTGSDTFQLGGTGAATFDVSALGNTAQYQGFGSFNKIDSSVWTLIGTSSFVGNVNVNAGTLVVNGDLSGATSMSVNSGGTLSGNGNVSSTVVNNGATLAPGPVNGIGTLTIKDQLRFQPGSTFAVKVSGTGSDRANIVAGFAPGLADLAGSVRVSSPTGNYRFNSPYTILSAQGGLNGTTFNSLVTPTGMSGVLNYTSNDVLLTLTSQLGQVTGLNGNQHNVAAPLDAAFNTSGNTNGVGAIFGDNVAQNLTQASGELGTAPQQTTFQAMTMFMGLLSDPFSAGRGVSGADVNSATGFADESESMAHAGRARAMSPRDAFAAFTKAPLRVTFDQRWSVWASGFGGSQTTDGNAIVGSNTTTSALYGAAVGADYWFSPDTVAGFAFAGGGSNFSVANGGSGRSDIFQAGAFVRHNFGATYLTAAAAYGGQDVTTDRSVAGVDHLRANFNTNAYSGRLELGHRYLAPWFGGLGVSPYAAAQVTAFELPSYSERAVSGAGGFALSYGADSATSSRTELGLRSDKSYALDSAVLTLRGRAAWAHDFNPDSAITATFQALPGASFVVNGAALASDSALTTASAEVRWLNGWSVAATFEGEFSDVTRSYAGKGVARYSW